MSCSRRLKPDSSTSRFAFIASDSLMSGSSSGRVGHHLFRRAVYESMGSPCCLSLLRLEEKSLLTNLLNQVVYAIRQNQSLQANVPSNAEGIPSWRPSSIFEMHSDISMSASSTSARVGTTGSVFARPSSSQSRSIRLGWLGTDFASSSSPTDASLARLAPDGLGMPLDSPSVGRSVHAAFRSYLSLGYGCPCLGLCQTASPATGSWRMLHHAYPSRPLASVFPCVATRVSVF